VLFVEHGCVLLDAPRDQALARLESAYLPRSAATPAGGGGEGELLVSVENATYSYGSARALDVASLELRRGEIVALTGRNGIGKTTLAKLVAGLLEPEAGQVERHGSVCYLSQDPGRYLVTERAEREASLAVGGDLVRACEALARVGLAGFERRHPRDLSTGERERLALASVLVAEPDVLVLDEPTRGVDPPRKSELADILRSESANRATLIVTHDLVFAGDVADRVVQLESRELAHA